MFAVNVHCICFEKGKEKTILELKISTIQYNTITLFKEGSAITCYSFLTYGPQV